MKKLLLSIFLTLFFMTSFGQSRLRSTPSDIKKDFIDAEYNLKSGYDKDGDYFITITIENAKVSYSFDKEGYCNITVVIPDNQGALNYYVEKYNKQYVIVSETRWKMYSKNGIANIDLIYTDRGLYYFMWSE